MKLEDLSREELIDLVNLDKLLSSVDLCESVESIFFIFSVFSGILFVNNLLFGQKLNFFNT